MTIEVVRSDDVTVEFDGSRCIHSRNCVLHHPDVFVPNVQGEWIHPERASAAEVLEIAHNCPSGAIQCRNPDGSALEQAPIVNLVHVRENGPLAFYAPLTVDGKEDGFRATLCRCGESRNKPYCDQSHVKSGFTATGEPAAKDSEALAVRDGELRIDPTQDGPLHVSGALEVVTGTGKTIDRVMDTYLCRCGHSQNKPYCDGSHAKVGFRSANA
ncbi:CDGSH iron-sulfur domain-containing protein [Diaphorobacter aerolatus]|uniref:CDGSH iron-sulfur domain-containing protein n=1 Tax=Diaphorobacter aerolatus TaxID=1288495 RepID=A0A7H0GHH9_9BURK|nr:CDGSH iron-sulfur domain-containing protein [Diaphorobacter aerolatus]QNP47745.1 CDGSH iron-sulfur domain-containing protein [Diaphorobacter aerolatus]